MVDFTVSRIQNRRGKRRDLPQPLDPGEFGLCIDTKQLFIGADVTEYGCPENYTSVQLENIANTQNHGQSILDTYIVIIESPRAFFTIPETNSDTEFDLDIYHAWDGIAALPVGGQLDLVFGAGSPTTNDTTTVDFT